MRAQNIAHQWRDYGLRLLLFPLQSRIRRLSCHLDWERGKKCSEGGGWETTERANVTLQRWLWMGGRKRLFAKLCCPARWLPGRVHWEGHKQTLQTVILHLQWCSSNLFIQYIFFKKKHYWSYKLNFLKKIDFKKTELWGYHRIGLSRNFQISLHNNNGNIL